MHSLLHAGSVAISTSQGYLDTPDLN